MKVLEYAVVFADSPAELTKDVQELLTADVGWIPQGGVSVVSWRSEPDDDHELGQVKKEYMQAMVRTLLVDPPKPETEIKP